MPPDHHSSTRHPAIGYQDYGFNPQYDQHRRGREPSSAEDQAYFPRESTPRSQTSLNNKGGQDKSNFGSSSITGVSPSHAKSGRVRKKRKQDKKKKGLGSSNDQQLSSKVDPYDATIAYFAKIASNHQANQVRATQDPVMGSDNLSSSKPFVPISQPSHQSETQSSMSAPEIPVKQENPAPNVSADNDFVDARPIYYACALMDYLIAKLGLLMTLKYLSSGVAAHFDQACHIFGPFLRIGPIKKSWVKFESIREVCTQVFDAFKKTGCVDVDQQQGLLHVSSELLVSLDESKDELQKLAEDVQIKKNRAIQIANQSPLREGHVELTTFWTHRKETDDETKRTILSMISSFDSNYEQFQESVRQTVVVYSPMHDCGTVRLELTAIQTWVDDLPTSYKRALHQVSEAFFHVWSDFEILGWEESDWTSSMAISQGFMSTLWHQVVPRYLGDLIAQFKALYLPMYSIQADTNFDEFWGVWQDPQDRMLKVLDIRHEHMFAHYPTPEEYDKYAPTRRAFSRQSDEG